MRVRNSSPVTPHSAPPSHARPSVTPVFGMPDLNLSLGMELVRVPKWTPRTQYLKVPCGIRARPRPSGRWAGAGVPECLRFRSFIPRRNLPARKVRSRQRPRAASPSTALIPAPEAPALANQMAETTQGRPVRSAIGSCLLLQFP